jgi:hypothetical protein
VEIHIVNGIEYVDRYGVWQRETDFDMRLLKHPEYEVHMNAVKGRS